MKRRAVLLLAAALSLAGLLTPQPASAHTMGCGGPYSMQLSTQFYWHVLAEAKGAEFDITPAGAMCNGTNGVATPAPNLNGNIFGTCTLAEGAGTSDGHAFTVIWTKGKMTFYGEVTGSITFAADATQGQSCITGADKFIGAGTLFYQHVVPL